VDSIRISRVRTYSGYSYCFMCISPTGLSPSVASLSILFGYTHKRDIRVLQPHLMWFGLFPFRSSLLRESRFLSFLRLLRYFSSPTSLHILNGFGYMVPCMHGGFPHSEIYESSLVYQLVIAYRRFLRPSSEASVKAFVVYA